MKIKLLRLRKTTMLSLVGFASSGKTYYWGKVGAVVEVAEKEEALELLSKYADMLEQVKAGRKPREEEEKKEG